MQTPTYQREGLVPSVLHLGVGGFHRSHMGLYQDEVMSQGNSEWATCGVGVIPADEAMRSVMENQDNLFTLASALLRKAAVKSGFIYSARAHPG